MYGYIYLTTNLINGKRYIGQKKSDKFLGEGYLGSGTLLFRSIKKYGRKNFSVELLEIINTNQDDLNAREIYWIAKYDAVNDPMFYNLHMGGNGCSGFRMPESVKQHLREIHLGENNPQYGKKGPLSASFGVPLPEERKLKISEKLKGRKLPAEVVAKVAKKNTGKKRTDAQRAKMKEAQNRPETRQKRSNSLKQVKHSDEWRRKQSESMKGRIISESAKIKISNSIKGYKWYNNGVIEIQSKTPVDNFQLGRLKKGRVAWNKKLPCGHIYKDHCNCNYDDKESI